MMRRILTPAALLLAAASLCHRPAGAADDKPLKGDLAKLQGTWLTKVGSGNDIPMLYTLEGNAVTIRITLGGKNGRQVKIKGRFRIDETAKPEKTVDWLDLTDPTGKSLPEIPGIYAFQGDDTLKLCSATGNKVRPTAFVEDSLPGGVTTLVFERVVAAPKEKAETKDKGDAKDKAEESAPSPCAGPKDDKAEGKDDAPLKGDLAKLQGDWTATVGPDKNITLGLNVKGRAVVVTFALPGGEEQTLKGEIALNEEAKPKTVDWVKFTRPNGEDAPPNLGIYTLDGDEFTVCSGGPDNPRPTEFKAGEGGHPILAVFTRKK